jgi:hypothetical protein
VGQVAGGCNRSGTDWGIRLPSLETRRIQLFEAGTCVFAKRDECAGYNCSESRFREFECSGKAKFRKSEYRESSSGESGSGKRNSCESRFDKSERYARGRGGRRASNAGNKWRKWSAARHRASGSGKRNSLTEPASRFHFGSEATE